MADEPTLEEVRGDLADLRSRIIYHAKHGRRAPKLRKAYQRAKARVAKLTRVERRRKRKLWASKHFAFAEFNTHDGTPVPPAAYDGVRKLCRDILEPMRAKYGACRVTSGYRHAAYNRRIGGATRSFHIYDLRPNQPAADVSFQRGNPAQWAESARRLGAGGVGTYIGSGFTHIDLGPRRDWSG
jgi:uncharacterized protein YcbK (DUF882 family)